MNKNKIILLIFFVCVGTHCQVSLQSQQLPDTVWSNKINTGVLKFSPDGQFVFVSTSNDGVYQLDSQTGNIIRTIMLGNNNVSFSPTGDTVVLSAGNQITFIDINTGEIIDTIIIPVADYPDCSAEITPDGKRILTTTGKMGFQYPQILVFDIATKQIIKSFVGRYYGSSILKISPDGKYFSFNDFRGTYTTVILIDLNTYEEIKIFEDPNKNSFYNAGYSPNAEIFVIANDNNIFFYNFKKLELIKTLKYYEEENVSDRGLGKPVFTNDSKYLIYGYFDYEDFNPNKIIVWNIEGDSLEYEYPYSASTAIDISKDDYIICAGFSYLAPGDHLYLLRPKWNGTDVKEQKENHLNYSYSNGKLKICFEEEIFDMPEIFVYNILGVGARHAVPLQSGNEIEIDFDNLVSGIYFVHFLINDKTYIIKINNY